MSLPALDDNTPVIDYRTDHTHPLVILALTIRCPLASCQAPESRRCDSRPALVHYARIVEATGMGMPKRHGRPPVGGGADITEELEGK